MFFNVSGGAYTTESLVVAVGPAAALLILALVPLFWSLPETLIIGELASMLPEEGGYYRWVYRAFGPFWAFQNGWWTWMYSLVDMAIYPVLFNQYLSFFVPNLGVVAQWIISLAVIWIATGINLKGAGRVGVVSVVSGGFILGVFLLVTVASLPHVTHLPWASAAGGHGGGHIGGLGVGLSIALWNYIGWDNASTVQGEVRESSRSYPRALAVALPLVTLGYLLPVSATLAATDWTKWREGGWPDIAKMATGSLGEPLAVLHRSRWNGERDCAVQCAPAFLFTNSVCDGDRRPAAESSGEGGSPVDSENRRARIRGVLLGLCAALVRASRCRRRASLFARAVPGIRGVDRAEEKRAGAQRELPDSNWPRGRDCPRASAGDNSGGSCSDRNQSGRIRRTGDSGALGAALLGPIAYAIAIRGKKMA